MYIYMCIYICIYISVCVCTIQPLQKAQASSRVEASTRVSPETPSLNLKGKGITVFILSPVIGWCWLVVSSCFGRRNFFLCVGFLLKNHPNDHKESN